MTPTYGDTATRVLLAVLTQPRPTVPAVALAAGCSRGHAHALLVELRDAGLVTWERGRTGTLRPACRVVAVEPQFGPVGYDESTAHNEWSRRCADTHPGSVSGPTPIKEGHRA